MSIPVLLLVFSKVTCFTEGIQKNLGDDLNLLNAHWKKLFYFKFPYVELIFISVTRISTKACFQYQGEWASTCIIMQKKYQCVFLVPRRVSFNSSTCTIAQYHESTQNHCASHGTRLKTRNRTGTRTLYLPLTTSLFLWLRNDIYFAVVEGAYSKNMIFDQNEQQNISFERVEEDNTRWVGCTSIHHTHTYKVPIMLRLLWRL